MDRNMSTDHRAIICLSYEELKQLLCLPETCNILETSREAFVDEIRVLLQHDEDVPDDEQLLPIVAPRASAPHIHLDTLSKRIRYRHYHKRYQDLIEYIHQLNEEKSEQLCRLLNEMNALHIDVLEFKDALSSTTIKVLITMLQEKSKGMSAVLISNATVELQRLLELRENGKTYDEACDVGKLVF